MTDRSSAEDFIRAYREAFEAFDASAVADLFTYPCQLTGDDTQITVNTIASREMWLPTIERIVTAYRAAGLQRAEVLELRAHDLTPRLIQTLVRWRLVDGAERQLYDFEAAYTLADRGDGLRITAIAHNETPRLRALAEQGKQGSCGRCRADGAPVG